MATYLSDDELGEMAMTEAALTHKHVLAGNVAASVVVLCRQLAQGMSWPEALGIAAEGRLPETKKALRPENKELSPEGFALKVLGAAIHFLNGERDFAQALNRSMGFAGPANYCPVLVGAIGGARWGASTIPSRQLTHCASLKRIEVIARKFLQDWSEG